MSDATARDAIARDARARRAAQTEFRRPLVLEAGAGTGKTATLVARVAVWCLGPGWARAVACGEGRSDAALAADVLRRVVAITFTEAAAAEMATRFGELLVKVAEERIPGWLDVEHLPPSPERRSRARALLAALDQLAVRTIHAFCRRLLAEHPLEAGVHPQLAVDADERALKEVTREVVEAALPELLGAAEASLRLARAGRAPADVEEALLALLRQGVPEDGLRDDPLEPARRAAALGRCSARIAALVALDAGRLAALGGRASKAAEVSDALAALADRVAAEGSLEDVVRAARAVDPARVRRWAKGEFGQAEQRALADDAEAFCRAAAEAAPAVAHLARLDPALLDAARVVLDPLLARIHGELRRRGAAPFPTLLQGAHRLLRRSRDVARRLRRRIDQLLVDEFQDTDALQCEILARLVLDAPEEERPGLFLVGDPKQSIYGWRNADLAAYDAFVARVEALGGERHPLVVNHRSAPEILDEVERVIAPAMHPEPGIQPDFQRLHPGPGAPEAFRRAAWAPVEHWVSWAWDAQTGTPARTRAREAAELEARAVARDLRRLHDEHGVAWSAIGLLFRGAGDLECYLAALRRVGVPFAVEGDRSFYQRREVVDAAALVRCVLDPGDQLALLSLLRSSVVGVPDAALVPLWREFLPAAVAMLDARRPAHTDAALAAAARAAAAVPKDVPGLERVAGWPRSLETALRSIAALRASFEEDPADVFVERLRTSLLFEATEARRHLGAYRVANLERLFGDVLAALEQGEGDPAALLRAMRSDVAERREAQEGRPPEAAESAVQVLTIHKAKGLAFDHVYVLQLNKGPGGAAAARAERGADGALEYALFGAPTPGYDAVEARHRDVEEAERVRTLYVALTRARRRLVIAGLRRDFAVQARGESHVALIERGRPAPDLPALMGERAAAGDAFADAEGARWVFPALAADAAYPGTAPAEAAAFPDLPAVAAHARRLASARTQVLADRGRAFGAAVSAAAHEAVASAAEPDGPRVPRAADRVAASVGTALHRALEHFDPRADRERALAEGALRIERCLEGALGGDELEGARARASALWERFGAGPLCARLEELGPRVLARELPVLLPPERLPESAAAGFVAGVVDLLYRDPAGDALVVADYKTDRIAGEADLAARVERYAGQGRGYVRAIESALGLPAPPPFELWFLDAGVIRRIPG